MSEEYQEQPTEPARDEGGAEESTEKESTEERKARRGKECAPKYNKEKVEKLYEKYGETLIPADEVDVREDKYHTFHKTCNTDLVLPNKENISDPDIRRAVSKFRTYLRGVLYCPTCDRVYTYSIEH